MKIFGFISLTAFIVHIIKRLFHFAWLFSSTEELLNKYVWAKNMNQNNFFGSYENMLKLTTAIKIW